MTLDWTLLALGAAAGAGAALAYLGGLAWGIRIALGSDRPVAVLLGSAVLRIAALLLAGWGIAGLGASALAGFAAAFMALRLGVLMRARRRAGAEVAPCS